MNKPYFKLFALTISSIGFFAAITQGAETEPDDEIYELSPFEVSTTSDVGYLASSTLSGSRIKTELRDVAASVTVLTDEFLDDVAADDIASALAFSVGAENDATRDTNNTNSLGQGYVGSDFGDPSTRSGSVRVRGLGRATNAADYIQIISSPDRYNIQRAEFLRGANSILFGLAEPAGLVNYSSKKALTYKDMGELQFKVDNFGSVRGVVDYNKVIKDDVLALRVAALNNKQQYKVKTAQHYDRRYYLTGTYRPFKKTTIRAYVEDINKNGRRPNYRLPQDNVSDWLELHNTYYDVLSPEELAAAFYWDPSIPGGGSQGVNGIPNNAKVTIDGETIDLGRPRRLLDGNNKSTALFYDNSDWTNPLYGGSTLTGTRNEKGADVGSGIRQFFVRSASPRENTSGFVDPQVTNHKIFPYDEYELSTISGTYQKEDASRYNLTIQQEVTPDFHLYAAFQKEENTTENLFSPIAQTQGIAIDINTKLPDGRDNPNFLRPFFYGRSLGGWTNQEAENFLFQANYDLDMKKVHERLGWMGFHRITALYNSTKLDKIGYRYGNHVDNTIDGVLEANQNSPSRHVYQFWYIGDPVQPGDTELRLTGLPSTTVAHVDQSYPLTYFNNTSRSWEQSPEDISISRQLIRNARNHTLQENYGYGVSIQSYFWNNRIVTLFGIRSDSVESYVYDLITQDPPYLGTSRDDYITEDIEANFEDSAETSTQSIVFHVTDWFRVFANRSENFAATNPRNDNLFRPIPPQNGQTEEYGFGLQLFEDRVHVRATFYESSQNDATASGVTSTAALRVAAFEDALYNALLSADRLDEWWTYDSNGITNEQYDAPLNVASTRDSVSKGWEVEVVANPTRNWRLSFNLSKVENASSNIGQELRDFIDARADFYKPFYDEGLRQDGTNNDTPNNEFNPSRLIKDRFRDTVARNYIGGVSGEGRPNIGISDYTAGLVSTYSFRDGILKGFSIGGSLRWESGKIIGSQQKDVIYNIGGLENEPGKVGDPDNSHYGDANWTGGMHIAYKRKLMEGKVDWKVQLNVQNMTSEGGLRVIRLNPDKSPVYGVSRPLTFVLTNTFKF
jgi:outer membrane receptor protein involved in Fe transport